jgi:hypothetical protein
MLARLKDWVENKRQSSGLTHLQVNDQRGASPGLDRRVKVGAAAVAAAGASDSGTLGRGTGERPKILVVGTEDRFPECVMEYSVHLAERLHYDLVAMNVATLWPGAKPSAQQERLLATFSRRAAEAAEAFRVKASRQGIRCEHLVKFEELGSAVAELHRRIKRIELVITDSEANKEEVSAELTIPVFSITPTHWSEQGGRPMAQDYATKKRKPIAKTVVFGACTVAFLAAAFTNSSTLMSYFTRGGWYAALPIATVFAFSFVHGAFASNLWSTLGIEARKRETQQKTVEKVVQQRKQARKRPRAYAYVNPWHRM